MNGWKPFSEQSSSKQIEKNAWKWMAAVLFALCGMMLWQHEAKALEQRIEEVRLESGTKRAVIVQFHPSENLMIRPAFAEGGMGSTAPLAEMAAAHEAAAAINGTFFNAYDPNDLHPMGAIMIDRQLVHVRGGSIMMGITASGELEFSFDRYIPIRLIVNGKDRMGASFVNHMLTSPEEIVIFTPQYRSRELTFPGAQFVVVTDGVVSAIREESAEIPDNGFVVAFGANRTRLVELLQVGDSLAHEVELGELDHALHLISVGPKLVTEGRVDVDFERDGFTDPKMTSIAAQRSFIGSKEDGTIVMGTVAGVTIPELAEIARRLGLTEAMNLDGGASSGLYYEGKLLTRPGRHLSNSLVVVRQQRTPRIQVNGKELLMDGKPFIGGGHTMVPAQLLEELGFRLEWSGDKRTVVGKRLKESVRFVANSRMVELNGAVVEMPAAAVMRDGHLFVPVRAVVEALGAKLSWDGERYMVSIESEWLPAQRMYEKAQSLGRELHDVPLESGERKRIEREMAGLYAVALHLEEDFAEAERAAAWLGSRGLERPGDRGGKVVCPPSEACLALGWSHYRAGDYLSAWETFQPALEEPDLAASAHLGLGLVYLQPPLRDPSKAEEHLRQAAELAPPDSEAFRLARELLDSEFGIGSGA